MGENARYRERSWIRSAVAVSLVIFIFLTSMIVFGYYFQKEMLMRQTELRCSGMAASISGGMIDALAVGNNDVVRDQFKRLKRNLPGLRAYIYDFSNKITFSTEPDQIGESFAGILKNESYLSLNASMLETGTRPDSIFREIIDNRTYLGTLAPSLNGSACFHCHGESRKVLGGIAVFVDTQEAETAIMTSRNYSLLAGGMGIIAVIIVIWFIFSGMAARINISVDKIRGTSDAVAESSQKLKQFSLKINEGALEGKRQASEASASSRDIAEYIASMASAAEEASAQLEQVNADSENVSKGIRAVGQNIADVSLNIGNVAATAEQMSASVTSVASAIEEMYASQNEVARSSGKCANVTSSAARDAQRTSEIVNRLGDAAKEIGAVVNLITGIAAQTNLLALNAAIEAAGAGDAGKGFAVVANEVKELAKQTAGATGEIKGKVEDMQENTRNAIKAIEGITMVIGEIDAAMGTIASSVEEQTATTNEISKSVAESAEAADSVARNITSAAEKAEGVSKSLDAIVELEQAVSGSLNQVANAAAGIARDAAEASRGTRSVSENVSSLSTLVNSGLESAEKEMEQAEHLAALADNLKTIMKGFHV